jgi:hypothetical protein
MRLRRVGKRAQTAFQIKYAYFLNPKSGSSFSVSAAQPVDLQGTAVTDSWNLTITYGDTGDEVYP